ncbi:3-hydroxyacyl-ACP dehydratase FabZ family protein [Patiriisocius hiemis]|uniref:3-hydroxyacyl-ACP dehydratase FabZ family protein n=1 Tax=Patiriisocius hiemis TaxID=3075604 RepID=A0ABU2Y9G1_9FLAO|nr:3-hydroxyacyl-ACP dehydratase FabZ family protein [Constantimarinum sp. W242]MDT0554826.1 3-hydroxyacyl-ACP dehydratase FabZ family protein [Constantimarinum sp. W242]
MIKNKFNYILEKLPYKQPFLFVDRIVSLSEKGIIGSYTFKPTESFYEGHFKGFPVTPGVILTECMAQIGLVAYGIYLLGEEGEVDYSKLQVAMTTTDIEFLKPVYPKESVTVVSEKVYFRFSKLKCKVQMHNAKNEVVCRGIITGMLVAK